MRNLNETLRRNFEYMNVRFLGSGDSSTGIFMEIPLKGDHIMVPVFALPAIVSTDRPDKSNPLEMDTLVVKVMAGMLRNDYKSLDGKVRHFLSNAYAEYSFNKLLIDGSIYYVAGGTILGKDFQPLMMLMWEFSREEDPEDADHRMKFRFLRPVMQMVPEMLYKRNSMERYIVNKIMSNVAMMSHVSNPYSCVDWDCFMRGNSPCKAKVVIDSKFDLRIISVDKPSISTTNEELLKVALDNLEEIVR